MLIDEYLAECTVSGEYAKTPMMYSLVAKTVNPQFAKETYEAAKEQTGKDIARLDDLK